MIYYPLEIRLLDSLGQPIEGAQVHLSPMRYERCESEQCPCCNGADDGECTKACYDRVRQLYYFKQLPDFDNVIGVRYFNLCAKANSGFQPLCTCLRVDPQATQKILVMKEDPERHKDHPSKQKDDAGSKANEDFVDPPEKICIPRGETEVEVDSPKRIALIMPGGRIVRDDDLVGCLANLFQVKPKDLVDQLLNEPLIELSPIEAVNFFADNLERSVQKFLAALDGPKRGSGARKRHRMIGPVLNLGVPRTCNFGEFVIQFYPEVSWPRIKRFLCKNWLVVKARIPYGVNMWLLSIDWPRIHRCLTEERTSGNWSDDESATKNNDPPCWLSALDDTAWLRSIHRFLSGVIKEEKGNATTQRASRAARPPDSKLHWGELLSAWLKYEFPDLAEPKSAQVAASTESSGARSLPIPEITKILRRSFKKLLTREEKCPNFDEVPSWNDLLRGLWSAIRDPACTGQSVVRFLASPLVRHLVTTSPAFLLQSMALCLRRLLEENGELIRRAELHLSEVPLGDAGDFLWPGAAQRLLTGEDRARSLIYDPNDTTVAVVDLGIPSRDKGRGVARDLRGRVAQLVNFQTREAHHDHVTELHGASCSALVLGSDSPEEFGTLGVEPRSVLLGVRIPHRMELDLADLYAWAAGLEISHRTLPMWGDGGNDFPPQVRKAADIFSTSLNLGAGLPLGMICESILESITRLGREGRGCLALFSAGNQWNNIDFYRPYGWSPHALSCAASTRARRREQRAGYSGWGAIGLCAPSSDRLTDMTESVWTIGDQGLPSRPLFSSFLARSAHFGDDLIHLESNEGIRPGTTLLIDYPHERPDVVQVVSRQDGGAVTLNGRLRYSHRRGAKVVWAVGEVGRLSHRALRGDRYLYLGRVAYPFNSALRDVSCSLLNGQEQEPIRIREIHGLECYLEEELQYEFPVDAQVVASEAEHSSDFGGTSAATALCSGAAALVLGANSDLTWTEAKEVLESTAEKIDLTNPDERFRWLNRFGDPALPNIATATLREEGPSMGLPHFSQAYGLGRLNVERAVRKARQITPYLGDLMIRNSCDDNGVVPRADLEDSPDIWVRPKNSGSGPSKGKHQPPQQGKDHWILVRIHNRGQRDSLYATLRVLVWYGPRSDFIWPKDWKPLNGTHDQQYPSWRPGAYFIDSVGLPAISRGTPRTIAVHWPSLLVPPVSDPDDRQHWTTFLMAELTPQDGALKGTNPKDNNNLAVREIEVQ